MLQTVEDYYEAKFGEPLHIDQLLRFADIIVWNIFQMDGLKYTVPNSCDRVITEPKIEQPSVFDKSGKGIKALKMTKQVLLKKWIYLVLVVKERADIGGLIAKSKIGWLDMEK